MLPIMPFVTQNWNRLARSLSAQNVVQVLPQSSCQVLRSCCNWDPVTAAAAAAAAVAAAVAAVATATFYPQC
jgi:hypothetical protein